MVAEMEAMSDDDGENRRSGHYCHSANRRMKTMVVLVVVVVVVSDIESSTRQKFF
jgi:hypothetical protein